MSVPERRRANRRRADLILELYEPDGKLIVGVGRLIDLSLSGAHFQTTLDLMTGQSIHLLLRLDEKLLLEIPSKVVREKMKHNARTFAVTFVELSAYTREKLKVWTHADDKAV